MIGLTKVDFGIHLAHSAPETPSELSVSPITTSFSPSTLTGVDESKSNSKTVYATIGYKRLQKVGAVRVIAELEQGIPHTLSAGVIQASYEPQEGSDEGVGGFATDIIDAEPNVRVLRRNVSEKEWSAARNSWDLNSIEALGYLIGTFSHEVAFRQEALLQYPAVAKKFPSLTCEGITRSAESFLGYYGYAVLHRMGTWSILIDFARLQDGEYASRASSINLETVPQDKIQLIQTLRISPSALLSDAVQDLEKDSSYASSRHLPNGYVRIGNEPDKAIESLLEGQLKQLK